MVQKHQDSRLLSLVMPEVDKLAQNVLAAVTRKLRPAGRRQGDNAAGERDGEQEFVQVAEPFGIGTEITTSEHVLCPSTPLVAIEVGGSVLDSKRLLMCLEYYLQRNSSYTRPAETCARSAMKADLYLLTQAFIAITKSVAHAVLLHEKGINEELHEWLFSDQAAFPPPTICRGADERAILAQ
eukprot:986228-Amphidinium_carterae.1